MDSTIGVDTVDPQPTQSYDGLTFSGHMIAGAAAGAGEHIAMFPVDTIKTRMQALSHPGQQLHSSVTRALQAVLRREGVAGLYRGVAAMALGAAPSHALYFATYEAAKQLYGGNEAGHHPLSTGLAGVTATLVNDGCMTPWDVVKQRMQMSHSPYKNMTHCIKETWKQEGLRAFYKSYYVTVIMNIPYTALHFAMYESAKKYLNQYTTDGTFSSSSAAASSAHSSDADEEGDEGLLVQVVAGGLAGGVAAAATNPLDVIKTRLQLEGVGSATRYNTLSLNRIVQRIVREEGSVALWRGWKPRVLFHVPSAAICWGIYESMKSLLASG